MGGRFSLLNSFKQCLVCSLCSAKIEASLCKLQGANSTLLTIPASLLGSSDWRLCGLSAWEQTWEFCADPQEKGFRGPLLGLLGWVTCLFRALKHQMSPEPNCLLASYYYCAQFKWVLQCIFLLLPSLQIPPVHKPAFLAFLPLTCRICLIILLLLSVLFLFLDIPLVRHTPKHFFVLVV